MKIEDITKFQILSNNNLISDDWFDNISTPKAKRSASVIESTVWNIWRARCNLIFKGQ